MVGKVNKSLKDWVNFVKKVQKEEGITYAQAMKRAKVRKDGGEKWVSGGADASEAPSNPPGTPDSTKVPAGVELKPDTSNSVISTPGGISSSTPTILGVRGGNKKQKTGKKQQKTSKKQKGGRRKTCYKK